MKVFSKQYIFFLIGVTVLTLAFRIGLSHFITNYQPILIGVIAMVYGLAMFLNGWLFGKADGQKNSFFDIGLRFNLGAFLLWGMVSLAWIYSGYAAEMEHPVQVYRALIIWGTLVIIHFGIFLKVRKRTIKGIHRSEIFD